SATSVLATGPAHGVLTLNAEGGFLYEPDAGFSGQDSFTYRANDGQPANNLSNVATVTLNVSPCCPPAVVNDSYQAIKNTPLVIGGPGVLANDYDVVAASPAAGPGSGALTLNANGSFTYTPNSGFVGPDSFTYTAQTAGGAVVGPATVAINVRNETAPL